MGWLYPSKNQTRYTHTYTQCSAFESPIPAESGSYRTLQHCSENERLIKETGYYEANPRPATFLLTFFTQMETNPLAGSSPNIGQIWMTATSICINSRLLKALIY